MKRRTELAKLDELIAQETISLNNIQFTHLPKARVSLAAYISEDNKENMSPNQQQTLLPDLKLKRLGLAVRRKELDSSLEVVMGEMQKALEQLTAELQ